MNYPSLHADIGDRITLTTIQNQTITGEVADLDLVDGGHVRAVAIRDDPQRDDPVWVRGDLIALWRLGGPVHVPMIGQNGLQPVPLPPEMLRNLRQQ